MPLMCVCVCVWMPNAGGWGLSKHDFLVNDCGPYANDCNAGAQIGGKTKGDFYARGAVGSSR